MNLWRERKRVNKRHKGHHKVYEPSYLGDQKESLWIILFKILTVMICIIKILEFHVDNLSVILRNLCFNKQTKKMKQNSKWMFKNSFRKEFMQSRLLSLWHEMRFFQEFFFLFLIIFPCYYYYRHSFHTYKIQLTSGWWMRIVILLHLTVIFFIKNAHHKTKYQDIHFVCVKKQVF